MGVTPKCKCGEHFAHRRANNGKNAGKFFFTCIRNGCKAFDWDAVYDRRPRPFFCLYVELQAAFHPVTRENAVYGQLLFGCTPTTHPLVQSVVETINQFATDSGFLAGLRERKLGDRDQARYAKQQQQHQQHQQQQHAAQRGGLKQTTLVPTKEGATDSSVGSKNLQQRTMTEPPKAVPPTSSAKLGGEPFRDEFYLPLHRHTELVKALRSLASAYNVGDRLYNFSQGGLAVVDIPPTVLQTIAEVDNAIMQAEAQEELLLEGGGSTLEEQIRAHSPYLRPFQVKSVKYVVQRGGRGLIADEMGLGKTCQAIAVAQHFRTQWPLLVVCPSSLKYNWARELGTFAHVPMEDIFIVVSGSRQPKKGGPAKTVGSRKVVVMSYDSVARTPLSTVRANVLVDDAGNKLRFNMVIVDECHLIKNMTSNRSKAVRELCSEARHVVMLSGTPAMSRPVELFSQVNALKPSKFMSSSDFSQRYCNLIRGVYFNNKGHDNLVELNLLLSKSVMIRRTKKEVLHDLPDKTRMEVWLQITPAERQKMERHIQAMKDKLVRLEDISAMQQGRNGEEESSGGSKSAQQTSIFQVYQTSVLAKQSAVVDYVTEMCCEKDDGDDDGAAREEGETIRQKYVIFAYHSDMLNAIQRCFVSKKIDHIRIDGQTPLPQRPHLVDHFQNDPKCVAAVLSITAAGTGLQFTASSTLLIAELFWNPGQLLQCEDRIHRMGQKTACTIKYLLAAGTIDDLMWPLVEQKLQVTSAVLSDDALNGGADGHKETMRGALVDKQHRGPEIGGYGTEASAQPQLPPGQLSMDAFWCRKPHDGPDSVNAAEPAHQITPTHARATSNMNIDDDTILLCDATQRSDQRSDGAVYVQATPESQPLTPLARATVGAQVSDPSPTVVDILSDSDVEVVANSMSPVRPPRNVQPPKKRTVLQLKNESAVTTPISVGSTTPTPAVPPSTSCSSHHATTTAASSPPVGGSGFQQRAPSAVQSDSVPSGAGNQQQPPKRKRTLITLGGASSQPGSQTTPITTPLALGPTGSRPLEESQHSVIEQKASSAPTGRSYHAGPATRTRTIIGGGAASQLGPCNNVAGDRKRLRDAPVPSAAAAAGTRHHEAEIPAEAPAAEVAATTGGDGFSKLDMLSFKAR